MVRTARPLTLLFHLAVVPTVATAQDSVPPPSAFALRGLSLGVTVDRYLMGDDQLTAISFRGVALAPRKWSTEFGLGLVRDQENHNWGALTSDFGIVQDVPEPGWVVLPRVGTTMIYGLGGNGGIVGAYGGVGVLGPLGKRVAIRAEVTRRWYLILGGQPQVWVLSIGLTSIPVSR